MGKKRHIYSVCEHSLSPSPPNLHTHTHTQLKDDLNTSLNDSAQQAEQLSALREALSSAEEREREGHEALEVLKEKHQLQMRELQEKVSKQLLLSLSLALP